MSSRSPKRYSLFLWLGVIQVDLIGGIGDAELLLQPGAAAERDSSAAQHGVPADIVVGINHDHRRTLVARHDRGRQPRGSCAGDDHISDPVKTNWAPPAFCAGFSAYCGGTPV